MKSDILISTYFSMIYAAIYKFYNFIFYIIIHSGYLIVTILKKSNIADFKKHSTSQT